MTLYRPNHFLIVLTCAAAVFVPKWKITLAKGGLAQVEVRAMGRPCVAEIAKLQEIKGFFR